MNAIKKFLILSFLVLGSSALFAQFTDDSSYDIWGDKNMRGTEVQFYEDGLISTTAGFYGDYEIYEAGSNRDLKEVSKFDGGDKKGYKYYMFPKFSISSVSKPRETQQGSAVKVDISATYPSKKEVALYLQNSTNDKLIREYDVLPIKHFGFMVEDRAESVRDITTANAGSSITSNYLMEATLTYPSSDIAEQARTRILNYEESVNLTVMLNQRSLKGGCDFVITSQDILNSRAFRDFVSPVKGQNITIDQATDITDKIVNDIMQKFQCKGEVPIFIQALAEDIFRALFASNRTISFEDLSAKGYLIDLDGERYKPDVIKRFLKSKTQDDLEKWNRNSKEKTKHDFEKRKETLVDTKVNGGFGFGLFKGDVKNKVDTDRTHIEDKLNEWEKNDMYENRIKNTFKFEREGNIVKPKGIVTHEVITSNIEFKNNFVGSFTKHIQKFTPKTFQIKYK